MTLIPMAAAAINNRALKSGTKYSWYQKNSHFFNLKNCHNCFTISEPKSVF